MTRTRARKLLRDVSTGVLRAYSTTLDALPDYVLSEHRAAVKEELLARDLPSIADDSGAHQVAPVRGRQ